ncbi:fibronectin type III domain-containing protein [Maribacter antarcticus]|uniref:fibronectin type III domain-containing protein n=1 Tax=Maribacter antarcticus TaxID=505250 RepID=UPI00373FD1F2
MAPVNLRAVEVISHSFGLEWTNSEKSKIVSGYNVYINSNLIESVTDTLAKISDLMPDSKYVTNVSSI